MHWNAETVCIYTMVWGSRGFERLYGLERVGASRFSHTHVPQVRGCVERCIVGEGLQVVTFKGKGRMNYNPDVIIFLMRQGEQMSSCEQNLPPFILSQANRPKFVQPLFFPLNERTFWNLGWFGYIQLLTPRPGIYKNSPDILRFSFPGANHAQLRRGQRSHPVQDELDPNRGPRRHDWTRLVPGAWLIPQSTLPAAPEIEFINRFFQTLVKR